MPFLRTPFLRKGFDLPSTGGGGSSAITESISNDQLDILKNRLMKDGFLSKGDLQQLISKSTELKSQMSPKTKSGRNSISNLDRQISEFELGISNFDAEASQAENIKNDLFNEIDTIQMSHTANPTNYINKSVQRIDWKLAEIDKLYINAEQAGNVTGSNKYLSLYKELANEKNKLSLMGESIKSKDGKVAAFVETDSKGRLINVNYGLAVGDESSGYFETNKLIEGIPLWLKPTKTGFDGELAAIFNGQEFSNKNQAVDEDGELIDLLQTKDKTLPKKMVSASDIDFSLKDLTIRDFIPEGDWVQGKDSLYKNMGDNNFIKYNKMKPEDLGLKAGQYQKVNNIWESRVNENVTMSGDPAFAEKELKLHSPEEIEQEQEQEQEPIQSKLELERQSRSRFQKTTPKEEKGGFVNTVKDIWKGRLTPFTAKEVATPSKVREDREPGFLDRMS